MSSTQMCRKHLSEPENLSMAEMRVLEAGYWSPISRWLVKYDLYERGLLDSGDWKAPIDRDAMFLLNSAYGRAYWKEARNSPRLPAEFVSYVDAFIGTTDFGPETFYKRIQSYLSEE